MFLLEFLFQAVILVGGMAVIAGGILLASVLLQGFLGGEPEEGDNSSGWFFFYM